METPERSLPEREILRDDVDENSDELMTESDDERFQAFIETQDSDFETDSNATLRREIDDMDYIPHDIRRLASYSELWNQLLNSALAMSILVAYSIYKDLCSLPETLSTVLGGFLFAFSVNCLLNVIYKLYERRLIENMMATMMELYDNDFVVNQGVYRRFSYIFKLLIMVFYSVYQIAACCIFLMFMVTNVKYTVEQQFKVDLPFRVYMMYFYVLAFVITLLKNLRILAPLTSNSAVTTYLSVFLFFAYFVWDPLVSHKPFGDDDGVALFIITVFFLMEILNMQSLNLISVLRNDMLMVVRQDERSRGMCAVLFSIFLLLPFLVYFSYMDLSVEATNVVKTPVVGIKPQNETYSIYAIVFKSVYKAVICMLIDYSLCNTIIDVCDRRLQNTPRRTFVKSVFCMAVIFFTLFFAFILPNWNSLKPFLFMLCLSITGIALPTVLGLGYHQPNQLNRNVLYNVSIFRGLLVIVVTVVPYFFGVPTHVSNITDLNYLSI